MKIIKTAGYRKKISQNEWEDDRLDPEARALIERMQAHAEQVRKDKKENPEAYVVDPPKTRDDVIINRKVKEWSINDWIEYLFNCIPSGDKNAYGLMSEIPEQMKQKIINILGEEIFEIANHADVYDDGWAQGDISEMFRAVIYDFNSYFQSNSIASDIMAKTIYDNYYDEEEPDWAKNTIQEFYNMSPFYLKKALNVYYPDVKETGEDEDDYDRNGPEEDIPPSWDSGVTPEVEQRDYAYAYTSYYRLVKTAQYQREVAQNGEEDSYAVSDSKMSSIDIQKALQDKPLEWIQAVSRFPAMLQKEIIDERPNPNQEDIQDINSWKLIANQPVKYEMTHLLRNANNLNSIARCPVDVIKEINRKWGLQIVAGKVYDQNPGRYKDYATKFKGETAEPSVMVNDEIIWGVGRFISALLRKDQNLTVWNIKK